MNFLQRLVARMRAIWAAARGYETGVVTPLPPSPISPRTSALELIEEAARRGAQDAAAGMQDSWSFGGPDDVVSEAFDPPYVGELRSRCTAAVETIRQYRGLTDSRLKHVSEWRDEREDLMASARVRMGNLAVSEARQQAELRRRSLAEVDLDDSLLQDLTNRDVSPDELPWEGESVVVNGFWRAVILVGLASAVFAVQYSVIEAWFAGTAGAGPLALSVSALIVACPYVAALIYRARQATGAERWIGRVILVLGVPWLYVAVVLGVVRGRLLAGTPADLAPVTMIVMLVALMLIVGVMAFMLGLARRHPFQDAYVRNRTTRNRLDVLRRTMADQINPAFLEVGDTDAADAEERAVVEAYAAAEYAYFAALVRRSAARRSPKPYRDGGACGPRSHRPQATGPPIDPVPDATDGAA